MDPTGKTVPKISFVVQMDVGMLEWIIRAFLAVVLSVGSIVGFIVLAWYVPRHSYISQPTGSSPGD